MKETDNANYNLGKSKQKNTQDILTTGEIYALTIKEKIKRT